VTASIFEPVWESTAIQAGAIVIYVSSSTGNNANVGDQAHPLATIAEAWARLASTGRDHTPDQILCMRGDVFNETTIISITRSGEAKGKPLLFGAYGVGARPVLTGTTFEIETGSVPLDHIMIADLYSQYNAGTGAGTPFITRLAQGDDLCIQNVRMAHRGLNIQAFGGAVDDVRIIGCACSETYDDSGVHCQGYFIAGITNLFITHNTLYHCGWDESVSGSVRTTLSQAMYIVGCPGTILRCTTSAKPAASGVQLRDGADDAWANFFPRCPIGLVSGHSCHVHQNVYCDGDDVDAAPRGHAISVSICPNGFSQLIEDELVTNNTTGTGPRALAFGPGPGDPDRDVYDVTIQDCIFRAWELGFQETAQAAATYQNIVFRRNAVQMTTLGAVVEFSAPTDINKFTFQGNRYFSTNPAGQWFFMGGGFISNAQWVIDSGESDATFTEITSYPDPGRTTEQYGIDVLGIPSATLADIMDLALANEDGDWNDAVSAPAFVNWFRVGGFGLDPLPGTTPATTVATRGCMMAAA